MQDFSASVFLELFPNLNSSDDINPQASQNELVVLLSVLAQKLPPYFLLDLSRSLSAAAFASGYLHCSRSKNGFGHKIVISQSIAPSVSKVVSMTPLLPFWKAASL